MAQNENEQREVYPSAIGAKSSLFSFEFIVDSVTDVLVECAVPAVGFRLLDYPTVIIYHTSQQRIENLRKMVKIDEPVNANAIDNADNGSLCPNMKEEDGSFCFQKGKSTLFNMEFDKVFNLLTNIPVYIVLLDVLKQKPRLVGSCTMSLQEAIQEIKKSIGLSNVQAPTLSSRVVSLNVFNLMGTNIGKIKGKYTLYSYGNSLSKHVIAQNPSRSDLKVFIDNQTSTSDAKNVSVITKRQKKDKTLKTIERMDKSTEINGILEHSALFQPEEKEVLMKSIVKASSCSDVQTNNIKYLESCNPMMKGKHTMDCNLGNGVCCPPPMFYCSEYNTDNFDDLNSGKGVHSTICNEQSDHNNLVANIPLQAKGDFDLQICDRIELEPVLNDEDSKLNTETNNSLKDVRQNADSLKRENYKSGELDAVLKSLDEMPLLQGLLKEIVKFSRKINLKFEDLGKIMTEPEVFETARHLETKPPRQAGQSMNQDQHEHVPSKTDPKKSGRKGAKKLKFRMTKSHQLRCAVNSRKEPPPVLKHRGKLKGKNQSEIGIRRTLEDKTETSHAQHSNLQGLNTEEGLEKKALHINRGHSFQSDPSKSDLGYNESKHFDQASMKSKSPVSLEIHLPSTAEFEDKNPSYVDSSADDKSFVSNGLGQTGIYTPPPLEKRWTGLDDLSRMKQSTDDVWIGDQQSESGKSSKSSLNQGIPARAEPDQKTGRKSLSLYSDEFHSATVSIGIHSVGSNGTRNSSNVESMNSDMSHSSKRSSKADTSRCTSRSRKSQGKSTSSRTLTNPYSSSTSSISKSTTISQSPQSAKNSQSGASSKSKRSISRRNISEASKPIVSTHSPTTSRSLRTKQKRSLEYNDEITQSVDLSDVSFRTDDSGRRSPNMRKDSQGPSEDDEVRYSEDFVSTKSPGSRTSPVADQYRTPTPKHIILSQAKLGYTM